MRRLIPFVLVVSWSSFSYAEEPPLEIHPEEAAPAPAPPAAPEAVAPVDPAAYAKVIRAKVAEVREKVVTKLEDKLADKQGAQLERVGDFLGYFSLLGGLMLLMPLWLRRRHPWKLFALFKYSAIAALAFFLAVNLFTLTFMLLRGVQGGLASVTSPQVAMVDGAFSALDKNADDLAELGPAVIEPTLAQLGGDTDEPVHVALLENLHKLKQDAAVFTKAASIFKDVGWLLGYMPILLALVTVVLFARHFWPVLRDLVGLPERAVVEPAQAGRIVKDTFRKIGRELLATLALIGVLIAVTVVGGFLLAALVEPAMDVVINLIVFAFLYLQVEPAAATGVVLFAIVAVAAFAVENVAAVTVGSALYLGKAQKIFRRKFHDKVPLRAHARFWKWGTLSLLWAMVVPFLFARLAIPVAAWLIDSLSSEKPPRFTGAFLSSTVLLVVGFGVAFWLAKAWKGIAFLARYKEAPPAAAPAEPADAATLRAA